MGSAQYPIPSAARIGVLNERLKGADVGNRDKRGWFRELRQGVSENEPEGDRVPFRPRDT